MDFLYSFVEVVHQHYALVLAFFAVAVLYSSVGFGGGSSYAALLSLTGLPYIQFRAISLLCNVVVVSNGTLMYAKNKFFNWKKIFPLVILSVPLSFLGGFIKIEKHFFLILLGVSLLVAGILMLIKFDNSSKNQPNNREKSSFVKNALIGGAIGFVSGMVGIGGGVFLAPLLHLTRWNSPKKIAAASSFFILVNSIAGLVGQIQNLDFVIDYYLTSLLIVAVFLGGRIGTKLSVKTLKPQTIKKITAVLIIFVGVKILFFS